MKVGVIDTQNPVLIITVAQIITVDIPNTDSLTPVVMDLQGPPLAQANREKIDALKRRAQEITRDLRSRDDVQISYLEMLEECDNDNLRLAQMLAG
jgi:hypothetical protein